MKITDLLAEEASLNQAIDMINDNILPSGNSTLDKGLEFLIDIYRDNLDEIDKILSETEIEYIPIQPMRLVYKGKEYPRIPPYDVMEE